MPKKPVFWPILRSDKECSIRSRSSTFALLVNTKSLAWFPSNSIILSLYNLNTDQQKLLWISVGIKILIDSKEMKINGSKRRRKIVKNHMFSNCRCRHLLMLVVVFRTLNFAISWNFILLVFFYELILNLCTLVLLYNLTIALSKLDTDEIPMLLLH